MAAQFAAQGYIAVAIDLYGGKVATNGTDARKYMGATDTALATSQLTTMANYLRTHKDSTGKLGTVGWCFGGGWSLRTSILAGYHGVGCVMYYGVPVEKADELVNLQADVLGIFAKKDGWITEEVIGKFEDLAKATGKNVESNWYDAEHAFANPTSPRYNEEAAQNANAKVLDFLKEKLK